jgi:hypothetical protein
MALAILRNVQRDARGPRRIVTGINYSEKTISVGVRVRRPGGTPAVEFGPTSDGKCLSNQRHTLAASHAAPLESTSARTSKSDLPHFSPEAKKPGRCSRPDLNGKFVSTLNGGVCSVGPKIEDAPDLNPQIWVTFPNIAHKFWDAYRQGGGVHLRRSRARILAM